MKNKPTLIIVFSMIYIVFMLYFFKSGYNLVATTIWAGWYTGSFLIMGWFGVNLITDLIKKQKGE